MEASPALHGNHPNAPSRAYGQLSVLVGALAVTSVASVWPREAISCPHPKPRSRTQTPLSLFPGPSRVGGFPVEKLRVARPTGRPTSTDRWPRPGLTSSVPRDPRGGDAGPGMARADSRPRAGGARQGQGGDNVAGDNVAAPARAAPEPPVGVGARAARAPVAIWACPKVFE